MKWTEERVFTFLLLAVTVIAEIQALGFKPIARFVPLVIGTPALLLALVLCIRVWLKPAVSVEPQEKPGDKKDPRFVKELRNWAWVFGLVLLIYLFGFLIAMLAFIFFFLKLESRESWKLSISLTLAVGASVYVIFFWFLQLRLYPGIIAALWG